MGIAKWRVWKFPFKGILRDHGYVGNVSVLAFEDTTGAPLMAILLNEMCANFITMAKMTSSQAVSMFQPDHVIPVTSFDII